MDVFDCKHCHPPRLDDPLTSISKQGFHFYHMTSLYCLPNEILDPIQHIVDYIICAREIFQTEKWLIILYLAKKQSRPVSALVGQSPIKSLFLLQLNSSLLRTQN